MYRKEGKPEKDVDTLTIYIVIATVLGARLGHVIFYEPEMFTNDPLGVILPFQFQPHFRFTGLQGLASHGAAFAILFALWLYSRKKKPGQNYLQVLDRIVILVAMTGALIRLGNFFNSEIIGKETDSPIGVVFMGTIREDLLNTRDDDSPLESMVVKRDDAVSADGSHKPLDIYLLFKRGVDESRARLFIDNNVRNELNQMKDYVYQPSGQPLRYEITPESDGAYGVRLRTYGVARYPTQLFESFTCLLLFALLFLMWKYQKPDTRPGRIFGVFLILLWGLRFVHEFAKKNQVSFEDNMAINMGQVLSIPLIIAGILVLAWSFGENRGQDSQSA